MRVLLLGAGGMLGRDLVATAPPSIELAAPSRIEITDRDALARAIDDAQPEWLVNAAAYTAVDRAETESARAEAVNGDAPGTIGALCAERGVRVLHFGSDYVFDGRARAPYAEDARTNPLGAYGRSKLHGEQRLLASGARALIVRTQWLFGTNGRSFPRTMAERARAGLPTRVVSDQVGRPTYSVDLARAAWTLLGGDYTGILHVANDGQATWFDVARAVFERAGVPGLVTPCTTADYPLPTPRPAYSVLDTARYESLVGAPLPPWPEALARFLAALAAEASAGTSATDTK